MDKGRIFKVKDGEVEKVLRLNKPSQKVLTKGDFVYRQVFSSAIRAGILTNAEATKLLKDRGIWDEEKEEKAQAMRKDIKALEDRFDDAGLSNEDGKSNCAKLTKLRNELGDLNGLFTSVTDNTAEALAHESRIKFYAAECTVENESGARVFKDAEEFDEKLNHPTNVSAYREALISNFERVLGVDIPGGLAAELPENKWMASRGLDSKEQPKVEKEEKKTKKKLAN